MTRAEATDDREQVCEGCGSVTCLAPYVFALNWSIGGQPPTHASVQFNLAELRLRNQQAGIEALRALSNASRWQPS